jgi:uncharacterized protein (DUF433 family)
MASVSPRCFAEPRSPLLLGGRYVPMMSQQAGDRIVRELKDIPHVKGRRITVLDVYDTIQGRDDLDAEAYAEEYQVDIADVYHALAYYHDHPEEMAQLRERRDQAFDEIEEMADRHRPDSVSPSES